MTKKRRNNIVMVKLRQPKKVTLPNRRTFLTRRGGKTVHALEILEYSQENTHLGISF